MTDKDWFLTVLLTWKLIMLVVAIVNPGVLTFLGYFICSLGFWVNLFFLPENFKFSDLRK